MEEKDQESEKYKWKKLKGCYLFHRVNVHVLEELVIFSFIKKKMFMNKMMITFYTNKIWTKRDREIWKSWCIINLEYNIWSLVYRITTESLVYVCVYSAVICMHAHKKGARKYRFMLHVTHLYVKWSNSKNLIFCYVNLP